MKHLLRVVVMSCLALGGGGGFTQEYFLSIEGSSGSPGGIAPAQFFLSYPNAPNAILGWAWGICQGAGIDVVEIFDGADIIGLNDVPAVVRAPALNRGISLLLF